MYFRTWSSAFARSQHHWVELMWAFFTEWICISKFSLIHQTVFTTFIIFNILSDMLCFHSLCQYIWTHLRINFIHFTIYTNNLERFPSKPNYISDWKKIFELINYNEVIIFKWEPIYLHCWILNCQLTIIFEYDWF